MHLNGFIFVCTSKMNEKKISSINCALNQNPYQLEPHCDLQLQDSLYFSMHLRDVLKCNACIHACTVCSFNDFTDDRTTSYAHSFLCAYL